MASKKAKFILSFETPTLIINTFLLLKRMPCIHYPIQIKKNQINIWALIDFGNKINAVTRFYITKLELKILTTDIGVQKIDYSTFKICKMVLASFQVEDKFDKI